MNPTWEEMVDRDPLISFSWYLSGRVGCVLELGREVGENLDLAFSEHAIDGGRFGRAERLMWFWTLGAYEVVRTMCQASECFSPELASQLGSLKKELVQARMPAAKMEQPGKKQPVTSNRSPGAWDIPTRDLLIGDPTTPMISARKLLKRFEVVISSITPGDIRGDHEDSFVAKA